MLDDVKTVLWSSSHVVSFFSAFCSWVREDKWRMAVKEATVPIQLIVVPCSHGWLRVLLLTMLALFNDHSWADVDNLRNIFE